MKTTTKHTDQKKNRYYYEDVFRQSGQYKFNKIILRHFKRQIFKDNLFFLMDLGLKKGKVLKPIYLMIDMIIVKFGPFNSICKKSEQSNILFSSYTIHSIILKKKLLIFFF